MATVFVFLALWGRVMLGDRVLLGGDILAGFPPWSTNPPTTPRNPMVSDSITQFYPWLQLVKDALLHLHLPLWDSNNFGGMPLLANDQSATFSPFTLVALPFANAYGYSLAMLLKLVVAGGGMAVFLRFLGARGLAQLVGGIAYAGSSFVIVWLDHPHSGVAALMVWAFAAAEWWLQTRRPQALAALTVAIALQFFAGHAETTVHLGLGLGLYAAIRLAGEAHDRFRALAGLVGGAVLGGLLSGIQVMPFLSELRGSTLASDRQQAGYGLAHLQVSEMASWIIPNGHGNPGIDQLTGRLPNYNESTGFVGIACLVLAPIGAVWLWRRRASAATGLVVMTLVGVGLVYGVLTPVLGRLPVLSTSANTRALVIPCLGLAALAGLGVEGLGGIRLRGRHGRAATLATCLGGVALLGLAACGLLVARRGKDVDTMLGSIAGNIGFWVLVAALSAVAACFLVGAAILDPGRRHARSGVALLVLIEAAIFAGPFQPRVPPSLVPPPSGAVGWLQEHAGGQKVAAPALDLIPDTSALYGLVDERGFDILVDPRFRAFWQRADPGYADAAYYSQLARPGADWLAAAGVRYYVTSPGEVLPGTTPVRQDAQATISEVPGARPPAFAAARTEGAADMTTDLALLARNPLGPVVVEGGRDGSGDAAAVVTVTRNDPGAVDLRVSAAAPTTVVVLQTWTADWSGSVDGAATPVRPADVRFQSVEVPAGMHTVVLRYSPTSVRLGALATGLGLAGLGLLLAWPHWVARRRGRPRGSVG